VHEILEQIRAWLLDGGAVAMATVVKTWGSSPRAVGARMAVRDDGAMTGSVSGGCVEGAVVQEALAVLETGSPSLLQYGVADETAWVRLRSSSNRSERISWKRYLKDSAAGRHSARRPSSLAPSHSSVQPPFSMPMVLRPANGTAVSSPQRKLSLARPSRTATRAGFRSMLMENRMKSSWMSSCLQQR
jgi:xanthine/CO dehydrogenase XdhC/CoxF family maturation factor